MFWEMSFFSMPSHARLLFGPEQNSIGRHSLTNSARWHVPGAQDLSQGDKVRIQVSPLAPCRTGSPELAMLPPKSEAGPPGKGRGEEPSPGSVLPPPTHSRANIPWQILQSKQGHQCPASLNPGLQVAPPKGTTTTFCARRAPCLARQLASLVLTAKGDFIWLASPRRSLGSAHPQGLVKLQVGSEKCGRPSLSTP